MMVSALAAQYGHAVVTAVLDGQLCFCRDRRHRQRLLERHPNAVILSLRFVHGLRTIGPIARGALQWLRPQLHAMEDTVLAALPHAALGGSLWRRQRGRRCARG